MTGSTSQGIEATLRATTTAARLARFETLRHRTPPLAIRQVRAQFRHLVDKVAGEAGLAAPDHAALALLQCDGDPLEAVVLLRAVRTSLPRRYVSDILDTRAMFVRRRISSAFREIPGGQVLGPTMDYSQRLLRPELATEDDASVSKWLRDFEAQLPRSNLQEPHTYGKVMDLLRAEGLLRPATDDEDRRVQDITREPLRFPAPRSARLQALARAETGAIMALAYSGMRGQGGDHPTIGEVRAGTVRVSVTDARGRRRAIGRLQVTEAENITRMRVRRKDSVPYLALGYGLCLGHNETKAICMGMLDRSMRTGGDAAPAISQEFVLYHTEGSDAWGSIQSLRMPAHVDLACDLDLLRAAKTRAAARAQSRTARDAVGPSPAT